MKSCLGLMMALTLMLWAGVVAAQADPPPVSGLKLGDRAMADLLEAPDRYETAAAALILGYGGAKGLSPPGIEAFIAVERTRIRVREMRRLMLADLDDDGRIEASELAVLMQAEGARGRGRLWSAQRVADADADGTVTTQELRATALAVALKQMPEARADALRQVMHFDLDGDGFVTLTELRRGMTMLVPET